MQHPTDLLEAYALRLLSPATEQEVAAHLAECAQCRAEVAAQEAVLPLLAYAVPPHQPPADLEDRLMTRIDHLRDDEQAASAPTPRSRPLHAITPARTTTSPRRIPWVGAVGALAALLVVALVGARLLTNGASAPLSYRDHLALQARTALHAPNAQIAFLSATSAGPQGAVAVLASDPATNHAVLVVGRMPTLANDHTYEFWLTHTTGSNQIVTIPAGTFTVGQDGAGELDFQSPVAVSQLQNAGISVERAPGVTHPDSPMLMLLNG